MIEINYSTMKITVILLALSLLCLFSCKDKKVKEELTTQKVEVVEVANRNRWLLLKKNRNLL